MSSLCDVPAQDIRKDIVIAVGNILAGDEGIGPILLAELVKSYKLSDIDWVDAGSGGLSILYLLEKRKQALILDCGMWGALPGTYRIFSASQAISTKALKSFSLHEGDLLNLLKLGEEIFNLKLSKISIMAIQPKTVELGRALSEDLRERIPEYLKAIAGFWDLKPKD